MVCVVTKRTLHIATGCEKAIPKIDIEYSKQIASNGKSFTPVRRNVSAPGDVADTSKVVCTANMEIGDINLWRRNVCIIQIESKRSMRFMGIDYSRYTRQCTACPELLFAYIIQFLITTGGALDYGNLVWQKIDSTKRDVISNPLINSWPH